MENEPKLVDDAAEKDQEPAEDAEDYGDLPSDEPEASDSGSSDDEGSEDEDGDDDVGGFVVNEEEDEDDEEGEEGGEERKKKRKKRRRELVLEEEDYELLEENTGVRVARPQGHRRLKKARDVQPDAAAAAAAVGPNGEQNTAAEQLRAELFGPAADESLEDELADLVDEDIEDDVAGAGAGEKQQKRSAGEGGSRPATGRRDALDDEDDEFFDEDDDDGWIVNEFEEDGDEEDVAKARAARRRRRRAALESMPGVDHAALEEANEIFGDVDQLLAMYENRRGGRMSMGGEGGEEEEGEDDDEQGGGGGRGRGRGSDVDSEEDDEDPYAGVDEADLSDEEAVAELRRSREERAARRRERKTARAAKHLEPAAIARNFLTKRDEKVRRGDLPEREQLKRGEQAYDASAIDFEDCADWIWNEFVDKHAAPSQARYTLEDGVREVEGAPPAWLNVEEWPANDMRGCLTDLASHRGVYQGRTVEDTGRAARKSWENNDQAQSAIRNNIAAVLRRVYQHHEEVPVVGMFRKEHAGELLALKEGDEPSWGAWAEKEFLETQGRNAQRRAEGRPEEEMESYGFLGAVTATDRRIRRWDVLYHVVHLADRWMALQRRRQQMAGAYSRAMDSPNATEDEREAISSCLDALAIARSFEALEDVDAKFKMVYVSGAVAAGAEEALAGLDIGGGDGTQGEGGTTDEVTTAAAEGGSAQAAAASKQQQQLRRLRPQRQTIYQLALRAGLSEAAMQVGLTPSQFAENLEEGLVMHEPIDLSVMPPQFASGFIDENIPARRDTDAVLRSTIAIATQAFATEPAVRALIRQHYLRNAAVSTQPTPVGETTLHPFHPLGMVKRYRNKPLSDFDERDAFLRLVNAEKEGLITVKFELSPVPVLDANGNKTGETTDGLESYLALLQGLYLSSNTTEEAQAWNELRTNILRDAVVNIVLPSLEREARGRLTADASAWALEQASKSLWKYASRAPLVLRELVEGDIHGGGGGDRENEENTGPVVENMRTMAVVWGPSHSAPTTFAILDPSGNLVDYLQCPQFSGAVPRGRVVAGQQFYNIFDDPKKSRDALRIREFLENHLPHALILGLGHPEALTLREDLKNIIDKIIEENPRAFATLETGSLTQLFVDEAVATLWEKSRNAREELPSSAPLVRRAVALARQAIDPLAVLTSLAGRDRELLALPLHPLQEYVNEEERWRNIEEVLVTATAQVGVDINAAVSTPWLASSLPFVPGLGLRKSRALLRAINRIGGVVHSRQQLLKELSGVLGPVVYRNAAPYLRVRASSRASTNLELDLLDDTRVHVESYELAANIAKSAINQQDVENEIAIETAMAQTHEVAALELGQYAEHLKQLEQEAQKNAVIEHAKAVGEDPEEAVVAAAGTINNIPSRISTLIDIQYELLMPYGDIRPPLKLEYDGDEAFWISVGEREREWQTLKPGRKVEAKVRMVHREVVRCVLSDFTGLDVSIPAANVSSKMDASQIDCNNFFKVGDTVAAVITKVDPGQRSIELATDSTSLNREQDWEKEYCMAALREKYYHVLTPDELKKAEKERRRATQRPFIPRFIQHPLFKNMTMADAAEEVLQGPVGKAIVRPATRDPKKLYLTMHIPGGIVWHAEIKELGEIRQNLSLAPPLRVIISEKKQFTYDDLDEFAARFVDPVTSSMTALARHRKWCGGGITTVAGPPPVGAQESYDAAPTIQRVAETVPWEDPANPRSSIIGWLQHERSKAPQQVAYCLAADTINVGLFYIGRIIGNTPRRERFSVLPEGFYFRGQEHSHLDAMLSAFKRDPQYLEKQERLAATAAAAAAPAPGIVPPPSYQQQGAGQYQQQQQQQQYNSQYIQQDQYIDQHQYGGNVEMDAYGNAFVGDGSAGGMYAGQYGGVQQQQYVSYADTLVDPYMQQHILQQQQQAAGGGGGTQGQQQQQQQQQQQYPPYAAGGGGGGGSQYDRR